jgi:hypothetical protein
MLAPDEINAFTGIVVAAHGSSWSCLLLHLLRSPDGTTRPPGGRYQCRLTEVKQTRAVKNKKRNARLPG